MSIKNLFKCLTAKALGGTIGYSIGGYEGAMVGAASSEFIMIGIDQIGADFAERVLSPREDYRIGLVFLNSKKKIMEKLAAGAILRTDLDIPTTSPACVELPMTERPQYEEIIEGFLLSVQREPEEKKLPFIENLLANVFFDSSIDNDQINLMIKISKNISYRQLCILCIFAQTKNFALRDRNYRKIETLGEKRIFLLQEIADLKTQGLLNCSGEACLGLSDVNPSKMRIQGTGAMLYNLMELWKIKKIDLDSIAVLLKPDMQISQSQERVTVQDVEMDIDGGEE
jgi:hypothetical protein